MKIIGHLLHYDDGTPVTFIQSPNYTPIPLHYHYLVMHYTAGDGMQSTISHFSNPFAQASAHLGISRDGAEIVQFVPFNLIAWHAGTSYWNGLSGLNQYSIGIELDNAGRLGYHGSPFGSWFGKVYDSSSAMRATHKNESAPCYWHTYTAGQIKVALDISLLIMRTYNLKDILGHDDIAPYRKFDPGPAFPMASFRARLLGRKENEPTYYRTTTYLNIRSGPGVTHDKLPGSPLLPDTKLTVTSRSGLWAFVKVYLDEDDLADLEGWVHSYYIKEEG